MSLRSGKSNACGSGVRLDDGPDIKLFILVGLGRSNIVVDIVIVYDDDTNKDDIYHCC